VISKGTVNPIGSLGARSGHRSYRYSLLAYREHVIISWILGTIVELNRLCAPLQHEYLIGFKIKGHADKTTNRPEQSFGGGTH
jgi:hypothetical protein